MVIFNGPGPVHMGTFVNMESFFVGFVLFYCCVHTETVFVTTISSIWLLVECCNNFYFLFYFFNGQETLSIQERLLITERFFFYWFCFVLTLYSEKLLCSCL